MLNDTSGCFENLKIESNSCSLLIYGTKWNFIGACLGSGFGASRSLFSTTPRATRSCRLKSSTAAANSSTTSAPTSGGKCRRRRLRAAPRWKTLKVSSFDVLLLFVIYIEFIKSAAYELKMPKKFFLIEPSMHFSFNLIVFQTL